MPRAALSDADMWWFLGVVARDETRGGDMSGHDPRREYVEAEHAGYLWLRLRVYGYRVEVTPLGRAAAHRWAARKAKEAAVAFARSAV